ncbi:MAG: hypothetical protein A3F72_03340 [Bacteroidetes bacterium RIFCSPLOWO2_12_FULL_35_15]|nr:MAG: hypothetical protein A3F72_03340 [Bacteroidetes bacterium RIFCSPLOWO2_12_FULL_35_15]
MKKYFLILFLISCITLANAQAWYPMNVGVTNSEGNAVVSGITAYQGKITIGGYFKKSGTNVLNGIAQWNDTQWQAMGIGVWYTATPDSSGNGGFGMATYNNRFYCSGIFEGAGGAIINDPMHKANNISKWDGTDWNPLSEPNDGVNSSCTALNVYKGNLYLGGFFNISGDTSGIHATQAIAKWNDTVFSAIGQFYGNFPPYNYDAVLDFTVYNDKLIAGGYFTSIDGSPYGSYSAIAAWNDTAWSALGPGLNNVISALTVFDGELYAGGKFTGTGDNLTALNHIAKWDGVQWLPVGEGLNDTVITLCVDSIHNKLIAGGKFTQTGLGQPAKHIAEWNGTNWQEIGGGTNDVVWSLYAKDSNLYVGGEFTQAGTVWANHIAVWGNNPVGINELNKKDRKIKVYPNPSTGSFQLNYSLNEGEYGELKIVDIAGRLIDQYNLNVNENILTVYQNTLSNGVYLYQIIINGKVVNADKLVIIKD